MLFKFALIPALVTSFCSCGNVSTDERPEPISATAASRWINSEPRPVIVDARTPGEFAEGHLAGARLITWTDRDFETRAVKELDRSQPVLVYCRSGARSAAASKKLASLGFTRVRNLEGGTIAWKQHGLPLTR